MNRARHLVASLLLGSWVLMGSTVFAQQAQTDYVDQGPMPNTSQRATWERRAVQGNQPAYQMPPRRVPASYPSETGAARGRRAAAGSYPRQVSYYEGEPANPAQNGALRGTMSENGTVVAPQNVPQTNLRPAPMGDTSAGPMPQGAGYEGGPMEGQVFGGTGCGCEGGCCPGGGAKFCDDCGCGNDPSNLSLAVFGGFQAFKTPFDLGVNGNFGVHEGLLIGGPFGGMMGNDAPCEIGWEVGGQGVHSDFSGADAGAIPGIRNQFFGTVGVFRRPECSGLQWGAVLDFMHDGYNTSFDFTQIRAEIGLMTCEGVDVGFWGAFTTDRKNIGAVPIRSIDMYNVYLRSSFSMGGELRVYGGLTGQSDGILGANFMLPLAGGLALENGVQYLIPSKGDTFGTNRVAQTRESWALMMNIVWYPGKSARCEMDNLYRPLLPVADNTSFILDGR